MALFPYPRDRWCSAFGGKSCSCRCPRPLHRQPGTRTLHGAWLWFPAWNPSETSSVGLLAAIRKGPTQLSADLHCPYRSPAPVSISSATRPTWSSSSRLPAPQSWVPLSRVDQQWLQFLDPTSGIYIKKKNNIIYYTNRVQMKWRNYQAC